MMKIYATLPLDRLADGRLWVVDERGRRLLEPARCRGEADNSGAAAQGNIQEDPTKAYGDHPYGLYGVTAVVAVAPDDPAFAHYGPFFMKLRPLRGQALEAAEKGRTGFGLHGGRLHEDGRLRETFGCNRIDNETAMAVAKLAQVELEAGRPVLYEAYEQAAA